MSAERVSELSSVIVCFIYMQPRLKRTKPYHTIFRLHEKLAPIVTMGFIHDMNEKNYVRP